MNERTPIEGPDLPGDALEQRVRDWYGSAPPPSAAAHARIRAALGAARPAATPRASLASRGSRPWHASGARSVGWRAAAGIAIFLVGVTTGVKLRTGPDGERLHTFMIAAPSAGTVSLVGDFNRWDGSATPMELDRTSGRWRIEVPLPPGAHSYAYIVDGRDWVVDHQAPIAADADLGMTNQLPSGRR
jgi:hypothetical protein